MEPTPDEQSVFSTEALTASSFLARGLAALEQVHPPYSDSFAALLLLGIGLERLCKLTLWLIGLRLDARVSDADFHAWGHKVCPLVDRVADAFPRRYREYGVGRSDHSFLSADPSFRSLLSLVHSMAEANGRYYYLDQLGGRSQSRVPHIEWLRWDQALIQDDPGLAAIRDQEGGYKYYYAVSKHRRTVIERALRAICRLYAPALFDGTVLCSPSMIAWASLPDDAIGKTDYTVHLSWEDVFRGFRSAGAYAYQRVSLHTFPEELPNRALLSGAV